MIALPVSDNSADPLLHDRFGRAPFFCLVEEGKPWKIVENSAKEASQGAGTDTVRLLAGHGVQIIIAPELGPKAAQVLKQLEVEVFQRGESDTVQQALENFGNGKLEKISLTQPKGLRRA